MWLIDNLNILPALRRQAAAGPGHTPPEGGGMTFDYLGGLSGPRQPRAAAAWWQPERQLAGSHTIGIEWNQIEDRPRPIEGGNASIRHIDMFIFWIQQPGISQPSGSLPALISSLSSRVLRCSCYAEACCYGTGTRVASMVASGMLFITPSRTNSSKERLSLTWNSGSSTARLRLR
jgi:hypothetical protein